MCGRVGLGRGLPRAEAHLVNSTASEPTVALFGLFGVGNIGNEASLRAAVEALARHEPPFEPVVVCSRPHVVAGEHRIETVPIALSAPAPRLERFPRVVRLAYRPFLELARWVAAVRFLRRVEGVLVPGTGILDDFGVKSYEMPYDLFRWTTAARLARRRVAFVGVGAGPIEHPISRWLMCRAVRNASFVTYRDDNSKTFMEGLGVRARPGTVQPDVAFGLDRPQGEPFAGADGLHVGLGVMSYFGWTNDAEAGRRTFDRYVDTMTEIADALLEAGHTLRLLVGEAGDTEAVDAVVAAVRSRRDLTDDEISMPDIRNFDDLLDNVAATDVVIATRYHNVVAGLLTNRPTISIGYAAKNREVMTTFGCAHRCHDVGDVVVDDVLADFADLVDDAPATSAQLEEVNRRERRRVLQGFDGALAVFAGTAEGAGPS